MRILAIETSGLEASIALADRGTLLAEKTLDTAGRRNARLLVPAVDETLRHCAVRPVQIDAVAVSIGPGSFTGLRVGVVFAKTFAWINDTQLVAVDTLQALAQRAMPTERAITVISDAQRGDVFVNSYRGEELVQPIGIVRIECLDSLFKTLKSQSDCLLTGPGVDRFSDLVPDSVQTAASELQAPRASALLPIAYDMIAKRQWSDLETVEPLYLRRSYAEEKQGTKP